MRRVFTDPEGGGEMTILQFDKNDKIYRWWKGGLWIKHIEGGWVQGELIDGGYIRDEQGRSYHHTLISILKIEEYLIR